MFRCRKEYYLLNVRGYEGVAAEVEKPYQVDWAIFLVGKIIF